MIKLNKEQFIQRAKQVHNDEYDYSLVNYINAKTKVKIICKKHGIFEQTPDNHLYNMTKCPKCFGDKLKTIEQFIEDAKQVHGNKYDYSLVNYINAKTKVKIICKKCNRIFEQIPYSHISGKHGCFKCYNSKGEILIEKYLKEHNINFISQKRFKDCKGIKNTLPFDFYLPDYNICIEYDGRQHYDKNSKYYSLETIKNDEIKNKYCKDNNINIFRITYKNKNNITNILNNIINIY